MVMVQLTLWPLCAVRELVFNVRQSLIANIPRY